MATGILKYKLITRKNARNGNEEKRHPLLSFHCVILRDAQDDK